MTKLLINLSKINVLSVLKTAESSDDAVKGKHEDSSVIFTFNPDSKYIYANDVDDPDVDLFGSCHIDFEFANVLKEHGLCFDYLKEYFAPIFDSGYEFSNHNETGSASLCGVLVTSN
ncbi:hypothetical protein FG062_14730 [Vibrio cholerae]|nr:hypothetical protein [Vibrio cholerae]EGR0600869.1 hypothetical protein [Vibrio cholerae]